MSIQKPIASVRLEGTVTDGGDPEAWDFGTVRKDALSALAKLQETHYILIVSPTIRYTIGAKMLMQFLYDNGVPFDEIWMGSGVPLAAVHYDNKALTL